MSKDFRIQESFETKGDLVTLYCMNCSIDFNFHLETSIDKYLKQLNEKIEDTCLIQKIKFEVNIH